MAFFFISTFCFLFSPYIAKINSTAVIHIKCKLELDTPNNLIPQCDFKENSFEYIRNIELKFVNSSTERFAFDGKPPIHQKYFDIPKKYDSRVETNNVINVLTNSTQNKQRTLVVEFDNNNEPNPFKLLFYKNNYPNNIHYEMNKTTIKKCVSNTYRCPKEGNIAFNKVSQKENLTEDLWNWVFISWQNNQNGVSLNASTRENVMTIIDDTDPIEISSVLFYNTQAHPVNLLMTEIFFQNEATSQISDSNLIHLNIGEAIFFHILLKKSSQLNISLLDGNSNVLSNIKLDGLNETMWKPIFLFAQSNTNFQQYKVRITKNNNKTYWSIAHTGKAKDITDQGMNSIYVVKSIHNTKNVKNEKHVLDRKVDNIYCNMGAIRQSYGLNSDFSVNDEYTINFYKIDIRSIEKISNNAVIIKYCSKAVVHKSRNSYYKFIIKVSTTDAQTKIQPIEKRTTVPYYDEDKDMCYFDVVYGLTPGFFYNFTISSIYHYEVKVQHYF